MWQERKEESKSEDKITYQKSFDPSPVVYNQGMADIAKYIDKHLTVINQQQNMGQITNNI